MKNVFFVQPPIFNNRVLNIEPLLPRCTGIPAKAPYLWPPIGMAYSAAFIRKECNANVKILDAQAENLSLNETTERVKGADLIIMNAGMPSIKRDLRLCKKIKEKNNETKIALMGNYASFFHSKLIENGYIDFVVRGEPEKPLEELIKGLCNDNVKKAKGITWKKGKRVFKNPDASLVKNLDALPFAARDLLKYDKYYDILIKGKKLDFIITARGCPFNCSFCSARAFSKEYRARSAKSVLAEVEEIVASGRDDIMFFDDTFTINKERTEKICNGLKKLDVNWRCLSRTDTVNKKLLERMFEAGCYQIDFGVESGSQQLLDKMNKGIRLEQVMKTFNACNEIGIETVAFFILGFPGETIKTAKKTIELAVKLKPDFATFNIFTPLPGSPIFSDFEHSSEWSLYDFNSLSFCDIPTKKLRELASKAYKEFYFTPEYLLRRIKKVGIKRTLLQNFNFWRKRRGILWEKIARGVEP